MKRLIELKHVGPKGRVRGLIEELIDRLEEKLKHFPSEALSVHVLFEENGTHKLSRIALTCHVPGQVAAAHEESRDPGATIREAFAEVERQLVKRNAMQRGAHRRRPPSVRAVVAGPEES